MDLFSFKKDKLIPIFTIMFMIWVIFLVVVSFFASHNVTFYDVLHQKPVFTYRSVVPFTRYFLEPFIGLTMISGQYYTWFVTLLLFYVITRIIYLIFVHKRLNKSEKYKVLDQIIQAYLRFFVITFLLIVAGIAIILGIGYVISGFLFINNNWQLLVHIGLITGGIIALIKLGWTIYRYYRPKGQLKPVNTGPSHPNSTTWKYLRLVHKEFRTFLSFLIIIVMIFFLFISIPFPNQKIETTPADHPGSYLFDFHAHTTMSDGFVTPEARVDWYISQGIDGAFFTDHENQRGYERALKYVTEHGLDFIVLRGEEYTYSSIGIHLNYYGVNLTIVPPGYEGTPGAIALNVSDMIALVNSLGGFVIVNHYVENASAPYTYEQLRDWNVTGFEIMNSGLEQPSEIRTFCLANNLACIAGTDIHTNQELISFVNITLNDPSNITEIFTTLKLNKHQCIMIDYMPQKIPIPNTYYLLDAFPIFLTYFLNLNFFQILSWILWSSGAFLFLLFIYRHFKNADVQKLRTLITEESTT